jgi:dTMP kinase
MGWAENPEKSFTLFQEKILAEYDRMVSEFGLTLIDATRSIEQQQKEVRQFIKSHLENRRFRSHS